MNKTVAVLIAGELYLLTVPAQPVQADVPELADVKALLAQHSDEASGICGAVCVDFSAQGSFKVADDGGNDVRYDVTAAVRKATQSSGAATAHRRGKDPTKSKP